MMGLRTRSVVQQGYLYAHAPVTNNIVFHSSRGVYIPNDPKFVQMMTAATGETDESVQGTEDDAGSGSGDGTNRGGRTVRAREVSGVQGVGWVSEWVSE